MDKMAKKERFEAVFTDVIVKELTDNMESEGMPSEAVAWYKRSLLYNVIGGKYNRGLSVIDTFAILHGSDLSQDQYEEAAIAGWCVDRHVEHMSPE